MMNGNDALPRLLKNKEIPQGALPIISALVDAGEEPLFVIVGDLNAKGNYEKTALIFTKEKVVCYDGVPGESKTLLFSDMQDVVSKRMYGNSTLSAVMPNGRREVFFRYTYSISALCDAAALFISHVRDNGDSLAEETAIMAVTYERALSVCPKCGRTLLHPGAECIMCRSKTRVIKKLAKYLTPHVPILILCVTLYHLYGTRAAGDHGLYRGQRLPHSSTGIQHCDP